MPKYRVVEKSFVANKLCEEGEIVEYDGEVAANLERVDEKKKAKDDPALA